MRRRFVIFPLNHTAVVIDVTELKLPDAILPPEGNLEMVPSLRFNSWDLARAFLAEKGATEELLLSADEHMRKGISKVLTIF